MLGRISDVSDPVTIVVNFNGSKPHPLGLYGGTRVGPIDYCLRRKEIILGVTFSLPPLQMTRKSAGAEDFQIDVEI